MVPTGAITASPIAVRDSDGDVRIGDRQARIREFQSTVSHKGAAENSHQRNDPVYDLIKYPRRTYACVQRITPGEHSRNTEPLMCLIKTDARAA
jgi:hypothetical protein